MKKMSTETQKKTNGGQLGTFNWLIDRSKDAAYTYAVTYLYVNSKI